MTELATRTPSQELVARIRTDDFKEQVALALPANVPVRRFVRATVTALLANPEIATAEPDSIFQSLLRSAQDGLLPDGREAALVMFGRKAVYMPMIGGFRKIAAEHGWTIRTAVVYQNDEFEFELGMEPTLSHKPVRPGMERGPMIAAYAVATHRSQPKEIEVMYAADIEKVRQTSRAKDSGPWRDWPERMWEKSAGRRLFAKLPLGERDQERIARVLNAEDLGPAESAAELYGPQAREALEAGSGADGPPSPEPEGRKDPAPEAAPVPARSEEEEAEAPGRAEASDSEPQFEAPDGAAESEIVTAAKEAAEVEIPSGVNAGRKLRELLDAKDGVNWMRVALRRRNPEDTFTKACWAFARVYMPELYEQVSSEKAGS
jgi:recombination protein RecT